MASERLADEGAAALERMRKTDAANLSRLKTIVKIHGVPSAGTIGTQGMQAFWVLVQHADGDPSLQEQVLAALSVDSRGLPLNEIALLTDRVQVNRGKPQIYGTQFHRESGTFVPDTIEDASALAERRKRMDLMPLADYECVLRVSYGER